MAENARLDFEITRDSSNGMTFVRPRGEIDLASCDELKECLTECDGDVVVDLAEVTFLDSSGLSVIAIEYGRLRAGGSLRLQNPQPHVQRVIALVGMEELLDV